MRMASSVMGTRGLHYQVDALDRITRTVGSLIIGAHGQFRSGADRFDLDTVLAGNVGQGVVVAAGVAIPTGN